MYNGMYLVRYTIEEILQKAAKSLSKNIIKMSWIWGTHNLVSSIFIDIVNSIKVDVADKIFETQGQINE